MSVTSIPATIVVRRVTCHDCGTIWQLDPGEVMTYCYGCGNKNLMRESHFRVNLEEPPHAEPRP